MFSIFCFQVIVKQALKYLLQTSIVVFLKEKEKNKRRKILRKKSFPYPAKLNRKFFCGQSQGSYS